MEIKEWTVIAVAALGIVGTLAGVIIAGLITARIKRYEIRRSEKERDRRALEDLHFRIEKYSDVCEAFGITLASSADQRKQDFEALQKDLWAPRPRLRSIQRIYAEDLSEQFAKFENAAAQIIYGLPEREGLTKKLNATRAACSNLNHKIRLKISDL
jgi:hypothetical protein